MPGPVAAVDRIRRGVPAAPRVIVRAPPGSRGPGHGGERADAHGRARRGQQAGRRPVLAAQFQPVDPPRGGRVDPGTGWISGDGPRAPAAARTRRAYVAPPVIEDVDVAGPG